MIWICQFKWKLYYWWNQEQIKLENACCHSIQNTYLSTFYINWENLLTGNWGDYLALRERKWQACGKICNEELYCSLNIVRANKLSRMDLLRGGEQSENLSNTFTDHHRVLRIEEDFDIFSSPLRFCFLPPPPPNWGRTDVWFISPLWEPMPRYD